MEAALEAYRDAIATESIIDQHKDEINEIQSTINSLEAGRKGDLKKLCMEIAGAKGLAVGVRLISCDKSSQYVLDESDFDGEIVAEGPCRGPQIYVVKLHVRIWELYEVFGATITEEGIVENEIKVPRWRIARPDEKTVGTQK